MIYKLLLFVLRKVVFRKSRISHVIAFTKYNSFKKIFNLIHCRIERKLQKTTLKSKPFLANTEPTNKCILHCPFCPTGKQNSRTNGFADTLLYTNIFSQLSDYLYLITLHGWGEPLLNKELPQIVALAHQHNICTAITTNGMLLNASMSESLIESKLDILYVSIDGCSEESYQKYRVGGSFEKVISNVQQLVELKKRKKSYFPFIEWQYIVFKHNEHEISQAKLMAKKMGINNIVFLPAYTEDDNFAPTDPSMRLSNGSPLSKRSDCNHLWNTLSIHWNGTLVPCCYDYDEKYSFGNIYTTSFNEIWNSEPFTESRKMVTSGDLKQYHFTPCKNCIPD